MRYALVLLFAATAAFAGAKNRVLSSEFPGREERIANLKKYLRLYAPIKDAEYDIYDVNLHAGSSIPGPTHRDFRVALKTEDAKKWLSDVVVTSFPRDIAWCRALIAGKENFKLSHPNDFWTYTGKNKVAFHFPKDAILCLRIVQE